MKSTFIKIVRTQHYISTLLGNHYYLSQLGFYEALNLLIWLTDLCRVHFIHRKALETTLPCSGVFYSEGYSRESTKGSRLDLNPVIVGRTGIAMSRNKARTLCAVCFGSLSCWKIQSPSGNSLRTLGIIWAIMVRGSGKTIGQNNSSNSSSHPLVDLGLSTWSRQSLEILSKVISIDPTSHGLHIYCKCSCNRLVRSSKHQL